MKVTQSIAEPLFLCETCLGNPPRVVLVALVHDAWLMLPLIDLIHQLTNQSVNEGMYL